MLQGWISLKYSLLTHNLQRNTLKELHQLKDLPKGRLRNKNNNIRAFIQRLIYIVLVNILHFSTFIYKYVSNNNSGKLYKEQHYINHEIWELVQMAMIFLNRNNFAFNMNQLPSSCTRTYHERNFKPIQPQELIEPLVFLLLYMYALNEKIRNNMRMNTV